MNWEPVLDWLCGAYIVFLVLLYGYLMQKDEKN